MRPLVALLLLLPTQAAAECLDLDRILQRLDRYFGEVPVFAGAGDAGDVGATIVTAAPDGTTFTVLVVRPDGTACMIGAGNGWSIARPAPAGKEG
ncbi:MAG: hypothetical protein ACOY5U_02410 [Pseudomonadota bacterium]